VSINTEFLKTERTELAGTNLIRLDNSVVLTPIDRPTPSPSKGEALFVVVLYKAVYLTVLNFETWIERRLHRNISFRKEKALV
jgi:hypothetical protein